MPFKTIDIQWIRGVDAKTWEDYFISAGEVLENSCVGAWITSFNQYMKQ
jgi:hypothetical protein